MNILSRLFGKILQLLPRQISIEDGNYIERLYGNYIQIFDNFSQKRNKTEKILLDYVKHEVASRLKQSLHQRVGISINIEEDSNQVNPPWTIDIKIGPHQSFPISSEKTIIDIFDREDINGRLLILGAPGSGKTTTLLQIAKTLANRATEDINKPIPVLLNLSSWKEDKQSIKEWIISNLKLVYGIRNDVAQKWLESLAILPLLDGLDELPSNRQEKCVEQINYFLTSERWLYPLVVCSRIEEYQHCQTQLSLSGSIIMQPLEQEQIKNYIQQSDEEQFWSDIKNDSDLMEIAKTPLLLNIMVISREEISLDDWQKLGSSEKRLSYLFDAYIHRMLRREYLGKKPNDNQTKRWLHWLASKLLREEQTEFFIEQIQPNWVDHKKRVIYGLTYRLVGGLILGLTYGLITRYLNGLIVGLITGLIYGVTYILADWQKDSREQIYLLEKIDFSLSNIRIEVIDGIIVGIIKGTKIALHSGLIVGFITIGLYGSFLGGGALITEGMFGFIFGIVAGLIIGGFYGAVFGMFSFCFSGLILGIVGGGIFGLINAFSGTKINIKRYPNQGVNESIKNGILLSILLSFLIIILFILIQSMLNILHLNQFKNFLYSLVEFAIIISIVLSILPVIKHLSLRLVLWSSRYAPWNYARFLNYATNRIFLQRVGGGYRFIHRLLQEHFAEM